MINKLEGIQARYQEISRQISAPGATDDMTKYTELLKEHASLEDVVTAFAAYKELLAECEDYRAALTGEDPELKEMAEAELPELEQRVQQADAEMRVLLLPKDPNDQKGVVMEIRAGTGGEEAALFGADLVRMYTRFAERNHFKVETLSTSLTELGGVKEMILSIGGKGVYSRLKFESGVHRVQRVPQTESGGRIHTSAATVAVLPEAQDVEVEVSQNDIRVDVYRSGGHGGQSVNTTDSAVRITHLPTGLVVTCQDEKSQLKNKEKAMRVLKSRLLDLYSREQQQAQAAARKSQVGSGDRSERVRTYNFPQGRVSDHRINMTLYKLEAFMDGDLDEIIDGLVMEERARLLTGEET